MDEEVGIEIKDEVAFVYSSSFVTDDGHNVINVVFLCEYDRGTAHSKSADEVVAVHWMTCDEIMNHPDAPHGPRRASEEQHWLGDSRKDSGIRYGKLKVNVFAVLADEENTDSLEGLGPSKLFYAR